MTRNTELDKARAQMQAGRDRAAMLGRSKQQPQDANSAPSSCGDIPPGGERGQQIAAAMGRSRKNGGQL